MDFTKELEQVIQDVVNSKEGDNPQPENKEQEQADQTPQDNTTKEEEIIVEIDGEKISLEELKKGYLRAKDYTQKLNELAEARKEVEYLQELAQRATPEKLEKIKAIIDGDETLTQEQKNAMNQYLDGIDPDDPVAKSLTQVMQELQQIKQQIQQQQQFVQVKQQEEAIQQAQLLLDRALSQAEADKEFTSETEKELFRTLVLAGLEALDPNIPVASEDDFNKIVMAVADNVYSKFTEVKNNIASQYQKQKTTVETGIGGTPKVKSPSVDEVTQEKGVDAALEAITKQVWSQRGGYKT